MKKKRKGEEGGKRRKRGGKGGKEKRGRGEGKKRRRRRKERRGKGKTEKETLKLILLYSFFCKFSGGCAPIPPWQEKKEERGGEGGRRKGGSKLTPIQRIFTWGHFWGPLQAIPVRFSSGVISRQNVVFEPSGHHADCPACSQTPLSPKCFGGGSSNKSVLSLSFVCFQGRYPQKDKALIW